MSRTGEALRGAAGILVGLTFLSAMNLVAFHLTALAYTRLGTTPAPMIAQIINLILGILLSALVLWTLGVYSKRSRESTQLGVFSPILDAMDRIAKGDFSVRLDERPHHDMFGKLVKSVNTMAVELNQIEAMRQEFISNVSHEIQSPLTSIRGFAQALRDDHLETEERLRYLGIIEAESMRLSKLSDNLLRLASLEAKNIAFAPRPYRLDRQIRSLLLSTEPQWVEQGLEIDAALEDVTITADEDLLSQVWLNLIHNSIKFTPRGGSVHLELCQRDGVALCHIVDTGIGIAEADLPHIFERFFKADTSRNHAAGGSGLGLSIVMQIIEMHGGTITVASQPGAGSTFTIALPLETHRQLRPS